MDRNYCLNVIKKLDHLDNQCQEFVQMLSNKNDGIDQLSLKEINFQCVSWRKFENDARNIIKNYRGSLNSTDFDKFCIAFGRMQNHPSITYINSFIVAIYTLKQYFQEEYDHMEYGGDIYSYLHPIIKAVSLSKLEQGFYTDAVGSAIKEIIDIVKIKCRIKTNREMDGTDLMRKAFGDNNGNGPILRFSPCATQTQKDIQKGFCDIFTGSISAIRNPIAHSNREIKRDEALRYLILLSILMEKVDQALEYE